MLTNQVAPPDYCAVIKTAVSPSTRAIHAGNAPFDAGVECGA